MALGSHTPVIAEGLPVTFRDQTVWRDPASFEKSFMLAYDFDEFCFSTSISSGKGPEVHEAYKIAVEAVLGGTAVRDFSGYGGLSNRAPLDVIQGLIEVDPKLIENAMTHASEHFAHPDDITDIGLGMVARFVGRGRMEADELTIRAITEMLVIRKKEVLMPQISASWPKPVAGFDKHWHELSLRRQEQEGWQHVHTAIVSSGHTDFIQKTLEFAGLEHPDVYMTDDEMRRQVTPRTKPDPYALQLVRNAWLSAYLVPVDVRNSKTFLAATKRRQMYGGDDANKDGGMARNDGIAFIHHDGSANRWRAINQQIIDAIESRTGFDAAA